MKPSRWYIKPGTESLVGEELSAWAFCAFDREAAEAFVTRYNAAIDALEITEGTLRMALAEIPDNKRTQVQQDLEIPLGGHLLPAIVKAYFRQKEVLEAALEQRDTAEKQQLEMAKALEAAEARFARLHPGPCPSWGPWDDRECDTCNQVQQDAEVGRAFRLVSGDSEGVCNALLAAARTLEEKK